jgi:hypothetical protein
MAEFRAGDAFLICDKIGEDAKQHLYIVLCNPSGQPPTVLIVPFHTATRLTDPTVLLTRDDHSFITHPTSVGYSEMKAYPVAALSAAEESRNVSIFKRFPRASDELMKRIIDGVFESEETEAYFVRMLRQRLGLPEKETH